MTSAVGATDTTGARRRVRGAARLAGLLGVAALALPFAAAPVAAAQESEVVELSADGVTYTRTLSDLFGTVTLSPLDQIDDSFWVRNAGTEAAYLAIAATHIQVSDPGLLGALTLAAGRQATPAPAYDLAAAAPCLVLNEGEVLQPGEAAEIVSTLALRDMDGVQGQGGTIDFTLRVILSDMQLTNLGGAACPGRGQIGQPTTPPAPSRPDTPPTPTPSTPPGQTLPAQTPPDPSPPVDAQDNPERDGLRHVGSGRDGGSLAFTGAAAAVVVATAVVLLAGGLAIWLAARRRRADDGQPGEDTTPHAGPQESQS